MMMMMMLLMTTQSMVDERDNHYCLPLCPALLSH